MKYGFRTPSLKKSISARTKGRMTRSLKRSVNPFYGKRGMGMAHPKRAMYNKIYNRTTRNVYGKRKTNTADRSSFIGALMWAPIIASWLVGWINGILTIILLIISFFASFIIDAKIR